MIALHAEERRTKLHRFLQRSSGPVSASSLAERFSVSRQIIVGDIALLRASGVEICATPRGYVILPATDRLIRKIACRHSAEKMRSELCAIVDQGCTVVDVIVEHPVYGQLTGPLQLSSRYEVEQFLQRVSSSEAMPLSALTDGIHLHTIACPDESACQRVLEALDRDGILLSN
ncbi:transcription repressor NadR [Dysosmobacter acutus]|uniref:transcription repressor NadR n=1 Tax=Dysosmobacter acutus TaxID=2841504 RepID=UPI0030BA1A43